MQYTFLLGPLHGKMRDISPDKIEQGIYVWYEVKESKNILEVAPDITAHQYFTQGDTMVYQEPTKIN